MSLLVSITFSEDTNEEIMKVLRKLKRKSRRGWFKKAEELNLTLMNLYDANDLRVIEAEINKIEAEPFEIVFFEFDRSRRDGGDIYWIRAQESEELQKLFDKVLKIAEEYEYEYEQKPFKQRVKLGESVIARPKFEFLPITAKVDNISLIEYTRKDGKERYKQIYQKKF